MREIEFRGLDTEGKMWHGSLHRVESLGMSLWYIVQEEGLHPVKTSTIGQFTGLYDKNGVKIFEGDIVSFEDDPLALVTWNEFLCCWSYHEVNAIDPNPMRKDESKHYIIHGNIHQNPELLAQ